jgi:hypothetical protein
VSRLFWESFVKFRLFALIAVSTTLAAAAGDNSEPSYYCHSAIADGGYAVKIWPDGAAGTAKVLVGHDSRGGVHDWATYAVRVTRSGRDTLFQGDGLTLTMSEGLPANDRYLFHGANFTALKGLGGPLGCSSRRP